MPSASMDPRLLSADGYPVSGPNMSPTNPVASYGIPQGYFPPNAPPPLAPIQAPRAMSSYVQSYQPQITAASYGAPYQTSNPAMFAPQGYQYPPEVRPAPGYNAFGGSMLQIEEQITKHKESKSNVKKVANIVSSKLKNLRKYPIKT